MKGKPVKNRSTTPARKRARPSLTKEGSGKNPAPAKKPPKGATQSAKPAPAEVKIIREDPEAIEKCRQLYHKYGGKNFDAIQSEMRKAGYPGWSKARLTNKGRDPKSPHWREGWVSKFGFDKTLELHQRVSTMAVLNDSQEIYLQIQTVRKIYDAKVIAPGHDKDEFYRWRDAVTLELKAKEQLDLGRANFETLADGWEKILGWLQELVEDHKFPKTALTALVHVGEEILNRARAIYGESEGQEQPAIG